MTMRLPMSWLWPQPPSLGPEPHPARAMLDLLSGLPLIGWEASFKLSARGIETGRLGAGIDRRALSNQRWARLLDEAGVPAAQRAIIDVQLAHADRVYVACQQRARGYHRKLYLECDSGFRHNGHERLTIIGYKWPAADGAAEIAALSAAPPVAGASRTTEYWTVDRRDAAARAEWLRRDGVSATRASHASRAPKIGVADGQQGALDTVVRLISDALIAALSRADAHRAWRHWQVAVREAGQPDAVLAFNFYDSGLRVSDIAPAVARLAAGWQLDAQAMDDLLSACGERELAWLAGGLGSDGQPFLTIYCAASREDAIQACFAADPSLARASATTGSGEVRA